MTITIVPEQFLLQQTELFEKKKEVESTKANFYRSQFLTLDLKEYQKDPQHLYQAIYDCYKILVFFPDREIVKKFKQMGLKKDQLRWFIPLSEIEKRLNKIQINTEIQVFKADAIEYIRSYLDSKFKAGFLKERGFMKKHNKNKEVNIMKKAIINLYKRRDPSTGALKDGADFISVYLNRRISDTETLMGKNEARKYLLKESSGDTHKIYLRKLLTHALIPKSESLTETKFYNIVYPLFKLLMRDEKFRSVLEFRGGNFKYETYEDDYRRYKYLTLKKKLFK